MTDPAPLTTELGPLARWSTSSHKYGFGVDNLRDGDDSTFWQSEGPQPHLIDLTFPKKVMVSSIHICLAHSQDDSYTPSKISLQAGTGVHDLQEVRLLDLDKPDGWLPYPLRPINIECSPTADDPAPVKIGEGPPIPAHHLRIQIITNHLNGKDTHVRGVKVFGLAGPTSTPAPPTLSLSRPLLSSQPPSTSSAAAAASAPTPARTRNPTGPPTVVFQPSKTAVLYSAKGRRASASASSAEGSPSKDGGTGKGKAREGQEEGMGGEMGEEEEEDEDGNAILPREWGRSLQWVEFGEEEGGWGSVEFRQHAGIR